MNAKHAILKILAASATFNALIGGTEAAAKIYYNRAPQGNTHPYCIVRLQDTDANDTKSGPSNFDYQYVQVLHMATTEDVCAQMAAAARLILDRISEGTWNTVTVASIQFQSSSDFDDFIEDKPMYTTEQIYKVMVRS